LDEHNAKGAPLFSYQNTSCALTYLFTFLLLSLSLSLCWCTITPRGYHHPSS